MPRHDDDDHKPDHDHGHDRHDDPMPLLVFLRFPEGFDTSTLPPFELVVTRQKREVR